MNKEAAEKEASNSVLAAVWLMLHVTQPAPVRVNDRFLHPHLAFGFSMS